MAFLDRLSRLFTKRAQKMIGSVYLMGSQPSFANNDFIDYVEDGYSANADLYSIVKLLSSNFARAKWGVYREGELVPDHDVTRLMKRPNPLQGQSEFMELAFGYKLLTGNTFIHALGPDAGINKGKPKLLTVLPSQHIDIYGNEWGEVQKYVLDVGFNKEFSAEEVLHMKYANYEWDIDNRQLYGLSPIQAAAKVLQVNNDGVTSMASAFQNNGAIGFFSGMDNLEDLTEEQIQALEERYRQKYMGPDKKGVPMFINGEAKWTKLNVDPVDLAIIDSQKWTLQQLCNVYQVPVVLLDSERSTYNNMSEAREALWEENLLPALDQFKDELNRFFAITYPEIGNQVELDYDVSDIGVLHANQKELVEWITKAPLTINEQRTLMGYEPLPDGDVLLTPINQVPLGESIIAEKSFKATYSDYPRSATNAAKRAIAYKEENGSDCGTAVGWTRARQLSERAGISVDTIKRTFSFLSRAETYYTEGGSLEECGNIMYLAWGGKSMKDWCERKLEELGE